MLKFHIENHQDAVQQAGVPRHPVGRILLRFVVFLMALLLLEVLLSCRGLDFTGTAFEQDRLTSSKTFSIDSQPDSALYIWNMRPIPFDELKSLVAHRLMEKGYQQASNQEADIRIVLTTFTEEPSPRSRITIMEVFDRPTSRKLWSGRAEIPYRIDMIRGVANEPTLAALLDLVPPHIGPDHASSDSMMRP